MPPRNFSLIGISSFFAPPSRSSIFHEEAKAEVPWNIVTSRAIIIDNRDRASEETIFFLGYKVETEFLSSRNRDIFEISLLRDKNGRQRFISAVDGEILLLENLRETRA